LLDGKPVQPALDLQKPVEFAGTLSVANGKIDIADKVASLPLWRATTFFDKNNLPVFRFNSGEKYHLILDVSDSNEGEIETMLPAIHNAILNGAGIKKVTLFSKKKANKTFDLRNENGMKEFLGFNASDFFGGWTDLGNGIGQTMLEEDDPDIIFITTTDLRDTKMKSEGLEEDGADPRSEQIALELDRVRNEIRFMLPANSYVDMKAALENPDNIGVRDTRSLAFWGMLATRNMRKTFPFFGYEGSVLAKLRESLTSMQAAGKVELVPNYIVIDELGTDGKVISSKVYKVSSLVEASIQDYKDHRDAVRTVIYETLVKEFVKEHGVDKNDIPLIVEYMEQIDGLVANGESPYKILEIAGQREKSKRDNSNQAQSVDKAATGGIDLNTSRLNLNVKGDGTALVRAIDPALFAQFKDAPGLVPVIIGMSPVNDLSAFLGLPPN